MKTEFTLSQKRALAVVTGLALLFGAYFLRRYFMLIVIAAVVVTCSPRSTTSGPK